MVTVFDLYKLYKTYFKKTPYFVTPKEEVKPLTQDIDSLSIPKNETPRGFIQYNQNNIRFNKLGKYGQEIWFPIELRGAHPAEDGKNDLIVDVIFIDACTIGVNLSKTIIRTPVSERQGTVKEIFNVDDYKFTVKGFLIGKGRKVPESSIQKLKFLFENAESVGLHGGYPEMFLKESCNVVITSLEFPEVQGSQYWIRPFSMVLESDFITELEISKT